MRIATDDGVELAVEVDGDGPGLLLVHGLGGAKEDFGDHIATLARDHTVVIFDHRGHGASDKPDDPAMYSLERLAADTLQVADAVSVDSFRLLGHSMGGMVARKVPLVAPERVDALIMMDSSAGPIPGYDAELMDAAAKVALKRGKDALKELLDYVGVLETPALKQTLGSRPGYAEFQRKKWADLSAVMWGAMTSALGHQADDLPEMASSLTCPLLVLVGEQDSAFVQAAQQMKEAIPSARHVVIADAGHSPQFENPTAWIDAMTSFLVTIPVHA
jgi:pimeloyl-ACP methyl ester carboxylesterase